jgi:hypothetical protein
MTCRTKRARPSTHAVRVCGGIGKYRQVGVGGVIEARVGVVTGVVVEVVAAVSGSAVG